MTMPNKRKPKGRGKSQAAEPAEIRYAKQTITVEVHTAHEVAALATMADIITTNGWTLVSPEALLWALMDVEAGIGDGKMMGAEVFWDDADGQRQVKLWKDVATYCIAIADKIKERLDEGNE